jgi:hypothetical protein
MTSATSATNEVPMIFFEKNQSYNELMAASSSGTYAKKFGKENHPKNITLVNDELPLRVEAHSYHQVGDKTLRANRDGSTSGAPVRVGAQSDCQVGEKHFEPIVNAPPVELLSEWERKVTVKLESKHSEPIAIALQAEVTHQQCSRVIPNP